jgi:hypothetical protein
MAENLCGYSFTRGCKCLGAIYGMLVNINETIRIAVFREWLMRRQRWVSTGGEYIEETEF